MSELLQKNHPLKLLNTLRIEAHSDFAAFPKDEAELIGVFQELQRTKTPYYVLGAGSNVIFAEDHYKGAIICLHRLGDQFIQKYEAHILCGAGVPITRLVAWSRSHRCKTFFRFAGIPGTVGGVLAMNAGTSLGWADGVAITARIFSPGNLSIREIKLRPEMFSYRSQNFLAPGEVILHALFENQPAAEEDIEHIDSFLTKRKKTQPIQYPNCGSVFKNPENSHAGRLIEECGLKAHTIGGAQISELHGNFIINKGGARGSDVCSLINLIQSTVLEQRSIFLHPEVKIVKISDFISW